MSERLRKSACWPSLFGGQGTINVPSWSPDSKAVAFVSYALVPDESEAKNDARRARRSARRTLSSNTCLHTVAGFFVVDCGCRRAGRCQDCLLAERRSLGAQLYTVRQEAARDLPAVLEAIRKIGYTEVETYWDIYRHPAAELRRMINDHGLKVPSGHFNYRRT